MLSPFRHGARHTAHERKTLHRKSKWEHKQQQHTGRHFRTELISDFNKDCTGQFSGVAGYDFLQRNDPQFAFQPQEQS